MEDNEAAELAVAAPDKVSWKDRKIVVNVAEKELRDLTIHNEQNYNY